MAGQNFILSSEIFPCSEAIYIIYTRYISKSEKPKDGGEVICTVSSSCVIPEDD